MPEETEASEQNSSNEIAQENALNNKQISLAAAAIAQYMAYVTNGIVNRLPDKLIATIGMGVLRNKLITTGATA